MTLADGARARDLRARLGEVYWLGGSACAGKTETARRLAARRPLDVYHWDDHYAEHARRADPARQPVLCRLRGLSSEELLSRRSELQFEELLELYREEHRMVLDDLQARPAAGERLVEGVGVLPELVAGLLPSPRRAVWLIAPGDLRRARYRRRGPWVRQMLASFRAPDETFRRWMGRDDLMAAHLEAAVERHGLERLRVEPGQTPGALAAAVAAIFGW